MDTDRTRLMKLDLFASTSTQSDQCRIRDSEFCTLLAKKSLSTYAIRKMVFIDLINL